MGTLDKVAQRDPNNHARLAVFDPAIAAPVTSSPEAASLGHGLAFIGHAVNLAMAINDELVVAFHTPASDNIYRLCFEWDSAGSANVKLREGATWLTATGGTIPVISRNRSVIAQPSGMVSSFAQPAFLAEQVLQTNPNQVLPGTVIFTDHAFTGRNEAANGKAVVYELANDMGYTITLTADIGSNAGQIITTWVEAPRS